MGNGHRTFWVWYFESFQIWDFITIWDCNYNFDKRSVVTVGNFQFVNLSWFQKLISGCKRVFTGDDRYNDPENKRYLEFLYPIAFDISRQTNVHTLKFKLRSCYRRLTLQCTTCHTLKQVKQNATNNPAPFFKSAFNALSDGVLRLVHCVAP